MLGALAAAAVLTAVTPVPSLPGSAGTRCRAQGSHTMLASEQARVFSVQAGEATFIWGCARSNNHRTRLGTAGGVVASPGPDVRLAGATVALIRTPRIETLDLRTSHRLRAARVGEPIGRVVLLRDGSFGAIAHGRVIKVDAGGRTVADRGPGIAPGSLRAGHARLRWRRDGTAHSIRWKR